MSAAGVRIVDPSGKNFSITGCKNVGELKSAILENCGYPVDKQLLRRGDVELDDLAAVESEEEMSLLIKDVDGGCECSPFYIKIQNFECKFRCSICYNGLDCDWNKCQVSCSQHSRIFRDAIRDPVCSSHICGV
jgi:hypothetical protein